MIPDIVPVNTYTGNNSAVHFEYDFLITKASELLVLHTDNTGLQVPLTHNIDYLLYDINNPEGGHIDFPIQGSSYKKLAKDETITLMLNLPIMQSTPYGTSTKLDLKTLEYSLDYIVRLLQILNRKQERSVKVQEGSSQTADDLINALNDAQLNAVKASKSAEISAKNAKEHEVNAESIAVYTKNYSDSKLTEITDKCNDNITQIENLTEQTKQLVITTGNNKLTEIGNAVDNIESSVITGRFIGELIPSVIPVMMSNGELSNTIRLTNGDWILQDSEFKKGIEHIKMVALQYPDIACSSAEYETMLTLYGECPKFVIDDETGMIRLPTIKSIIQGVTSLADLGKVTKVGLLDISNTIYGSNDTIKSQTVNAAYYIVLATGVDQNVKYLSDIEISDFCPLLQPVYSDKLIFSTFYIRSSGQWNDAGRYPAVWSYLIDKYTKGTVKTFSDITYTEGDDLIKITDISNERKVNELYNSTGSAWFYLIDIQNRKFKLPLVDKNRNNEYLYFKAGNAVQNPQLINTARIEENINKTISNTADKSLSNVDANIDYVVYSHISGSQWCKIYKSGWHVEGGSVGSLGYDGITTWNFLRPYRSVFFVGGSTSYSQGAGNKRASWRIHNIQPTYLQIQARFEQGNASIWWRSEGN